MIQAGNSFSIPGVAKKSPGELRLVFGRKTCFNSKLICHLIFKLKVEGVLSGIVVSNMAIEHFWSIGKGGRADEEVMEIPNVCIKYEIDARAQTHTDVPVNSASSVFDQE